MVYTTEKEERDVRNTRGKRRRVMVLQRTSRWRKRTLGSAAFVSELESRPPGFDRKTSERERDRKERERERC